MKDHVHVQNSGESVRLEVFLGGASVVLNPEANKPLSAIAARIAKKLVPQMRGAGTKNSNSGKRGSAGVDSTTCVFVVLSEDEHQPACESATVATLLDSRCALKIVEDCPSTSSSRDEGAEEAAETAAENPRIRPLLPVYVNLPKASGLALPGHPLVGLPIWPIAALENTDRADWRWFRRCSAEVDPILVGRDRVYVPSEADLGSTLRCECKALWPVVGEVVDRSGTDSSEKGNTSGDGDDRVLAPSSCAAETANVVETAPPEPAWPGRPARSSRSRTTATETAEDNRNSFRVLSWNLLADYNLRRDLADGDACYRHLLANDGSAVSKCRDIEFRRQLLFREMSLWNADILCLQEVDRDSVFGNYLQGVLRERGYDSTYANKVHTSTPVGNAVFWDTARWELKAVQTLDLTRGKEIEVLLEASPTLGFAMGKTTTVANLVLLRDRTRAGGKRGDLIVANLHLFGDPGAPHIRLLQMRLVLSAAERLAAGADRDTTGTEDPHEDGAGAAEPPPASGCALVVVGDFNAGPMAGICELLTVGRVREDHPEWSMSRNFAWGPECAKHALAHEDAWCPAMELSHGFSELAAATSSSSHPHVDGHGRDSGSGFYTYWNGRFGCVVDHVFASASVLEASLLPGCVPPVDVPQRAGVASPAFPSDHAPVVAQMRWKS